MSKIAILSDIHSNLPAFKAVLKDVQTSGASRIVFLGDIVGYGASPAECVDLVRKLGGCCVMGNHEVAVRTVRRRGDSSLGPDWKSCGYQAGLAHSARSLNGEQAAWLSALPFSREIPGALVAHACLDDPEGFDYIENAVDAEASFQVLMKEKTKLGFVGHTHVPVVLAEDDDALEWLDETHVRIPSKMACIVNVGSVGQPRHETDRRASWVLWDPEESVVEFRKTDYNRLLAARAIAMAGLPANSALRLLTVEEAAFLSS